MAVLPLTTLERVKAYGAIGVAKNGSTQPVRADTDETLTSMIASVSQKMEQYCSRIFGIGAVVEAGTLSCDEFICFQTPISSISQVRYSSTGRRADLAVLPASQYEISPSGDNIRIYDVEYGGLAEVSFTGGLATDTADVIAKHPVLEDACKMQVVSLWQRHTMPDRTGTTIGPGETTWTAEYSLLKSVRADLDQQYNNRHKFL